MKKRIAVIFGASLVFFYSCSYESNNNEKNNESLLVSGTEDGVIAREYSFSGELCNYIVDESTGQKTAVKQNMHPFQFDGKPETTIYSYIANIVCGYPLEGNVMVFMLQDGILLDVGYQGESQQIQSLPYQNGKRLNADLTVDIPFVTADKRIALCAYLSDPCISTDYEEFDLHSESISTLFYTYEILNDYPPLHSDQIVQCDLIKPYEEIYISTQDTPESEIHQEFVCFSNTERYVSPETGFLLTLSDEDQPILLCNKLSGNYRAFVVLNDQPIPAFSGALYLDLSCTDDIVNIYPITLPDLEIGQIYTLKLIMTDLSTMKPEMACSQLVMRKSS